MWVLYFKALKSNAAILNGSKEVFKGDEDAP